jgi:uncharacterized protein DUF3857/uncharacterized protein DUF3858
MKNITMLIALLILAAPLAAQTDPTADAEYLNMRYEYTLHDDGTQSMTYSHKLKLYTGYAFSRAYGETFIVYNPRWQKLKVTKSVTKMADGSMVESPYNAYNEVLPRFAHKAASYNYLREMVVTHTGLEPNAIINLEYTLSTKAGYMPGLMDRILLAQRSPINNLEVVVNVPTGKTLHHSLKNTSEQAPSVSKSGGMDVYSWTFKNRPLVAIEANQPSMWQFSPVLMFSTSTEAELADHSMKSRSRYTLDEKTKSIVMDAVKDIEKPELKILALQKFMHARIAVMSGGMKHTGYMPQDAQITWDKAVGSELDNAVLLTAMCKSVGVKVLPTLISDTRRQESDGLKLSSIVDKELSTVETTSNQTSCFQRFGSAAVAWNNDVDVVASYSLYTVAGTQNTSGTLALINRMYLPLERDRPELDTRFINFYQRGENASLSTASDWSIKDDGMLFGRTAIEATSALASDYSPEAMGKTAVKAFARAGWGMEAIAEESKVLGQDYSGCTIKLESKTPASAANGWLHFALPNYGHLANLHVKTSSAPRTTPVDLKVPLAEEHLMTLHYPRGTKPVNLPKKLEMKNAAGSIRSIFIDHGKDIEIIRSIELAEIIQPAQYQDLKALMDTWNDPARNEIVFEMK